MQTRRSSQPIHTAVYFLPSTCIMRCMIIGSLIHHSPIDIFVGATFQYFRFISIDIQMICISRKDTTYFRSQMKKTSVILVSFYNQPLTISFNIVGPLVVFQKRYFGIFPLSMFGSLFGASKVKKVLFLVFLGILTFSTRKAGKLEKI